MAATYRIELTPAAQRDLAALPREMLKRVDARILTLAEDPYRGAKKLEGPEGFLRVRVGDYRIIYQVEGDRLVVIVVRVGHRREVYRKR
ncbi:MAG: type II toxin-antitoxin system RelE/ParE family toxin [Deltaproteobacteria bacterium]|nr:type II toxin-antitoxin system RelE/ParE family toxin [Deltaproteobacteria bacterium]MBI3079672.1 type II toxin-antitoxin system RelE/ParE family toxin [Deltaproteobacteria bacterium]